MPDRKKPTGDQAGSCESFGAGLAPDFSPLGKRIVIRPGKNQVKLKMRQEAPKSESRQRVKPRRIDRKE